MNRTEACKAKLRQCVGATEGSSCAKTPGRDVAAARSAVSGTTSENRHVFASTGAHGAFQVADHARRGSHVTRGRVLSGRGVSVECLWRLAAQKHPKFVATVWLDGCKHTRPNKPRRVSQGLPRTGRKTPRDGRRSTDRTRSAGSVLALDRGKGLQAPPKARFAARERTKGAPQVCRDGLQPLALAWMHGNTGGQQGSPEPKPVGTSSIGRRCDGWS